MDTKGAAYHRKEHILNESYSRLNNLLKGDKEDVVEEDESKELPVKMDEAKHTTHNKVLNREHRDDASENPEEIIEEDDPNKVRLRGYLEVHLYLFAFLFGAFLCYYRHHEHLTNYYPKFLHNFFLFLKKKGAHRVSDHFFKTWRLVPDENKKKLIKYMSYGTVGISLYPVLTAPKKPRKPETPEETRLREKKDKLNLQFIKYGTAVLRVLSATVLCGLVGYDLSYNLDFLKSLLFKK